MTEQPDEAVKREKEEELAAALRATYVPGTQPTGDGRLVIEATAFVTHATLNVWTDAKHGGNDPAGNYTRLSGCDRAATLNIEAR